MKSGLIVLEQEKPPENSEPQIFSHEYLGIDQLPAFLREIVDQCGRLLSIYPDRSGILPRYTVIYETRKPISFEVRT